jgi:hypothetical protein
MTPKFLLTIVALNTLFLAGSIATAPNVKAEDNLPELSRTISKLVNLDSKYYHLVTSAVDRAIASKRIVIVERVKKINPPLPVHVTAGVIAPPIRPTPQADRQASEKDNKTILPSDSTTTENKNIVDRK